MRALRNSNIIWLIFIVLIFCMFFIIIQQFANLSQTLRVTYARDVAANITAAAAVNYTIRKFHPGLGTVISNCRELSKLESIYLPNQLQIIDKEIKADEMTNCELNATGNHIIQFKAIGVR